MPDETIPPALTPAEWAAAAAERGAITIERTPSGALWLEEQRRGPVGVMQSGLPAVMALANAALPDGDPRKITPEDLVAARVYAEERHDERSYAEFDALYDRFEGLMAKLAALLPPEGM
jgi:hypothetical protein